MWICFVDLEADDEKACDFGAIGLRQDEGLHTHSKVDFEKFIANSDFICGHNIIDFDTKYFEVPDGTKCVDTLPVSPLLFPSKPYHKLLKDDKLCADELNNPLNDAKKARVLFLDEVNAFWSLNSPLKAIYCALLRENPYFSAFFDFLSFDVREDPEPLIKDFFHGKICENTPLRRLIQESPTELAYCLALLSASDTQSLIPKWVHFRYPKTDTVLRLLRGISCHNCDYCRSHLNPLHYLNKYFGYTSFRQWNGEPLQENAVNAAVEHRSLLAIFPTGGGKSLTFQIPALMAGESERALTVVISPLQSLMKDQVDSLKSRNIAEAVAINGLLNAVERAEAIERVESGLASILYISPESLRSATVERLLLSRKIDRFVIDEAHCFSAWGQDFRVDYLYIGEFIKALQEKKNDGAVIPVSCFTATAKQKVISDIHDYFSRTLDLNLELFATEATRTNLRYRVLHCEDDREKYNTLRRLLEQTQCPTIVYASRIARTEKLAKQLEGDGFLVRAFHGKMDKSEKQENQEAFLKDEIQVIVATSAFGMGVDKPNVGLVVHYDISDSLENYLQEAGRAGRDPSMNAVCYVLYHDSDLDKHFMLLNQSKVSMSEIQQVWRAIKSLTKTRAEVCRSPLEIARAAGWDDSVQDIETRVKTAIQALETAGYLQRGKNDPRVYATGILAKSMNEAARRIDQSGVFQSEEEKTTAKRIIRSLISARSVGKAGNDDAESRVEYLADRLGLEKAEVLDSIQQMRQDGLLADTKDMSAYIQKTDTENKSMLILHKFHRLEEFLLPRLGSSEAVWNYKQLNETALASGIKSSSVKNIKTLVYYWTIKGYIKKGEHTNTNQIHILPNDSKEQLLGKRRGNWSVSEFIIRYLYRAGREKGTDNESTAVEFSELELADKWKEETGREVSLREIEDALLFLTTIDALKVEGGFLVLYNGMRIKRLAESRTQYKKDDYKFLNEYYQQKIQQIHIVGEFANMMVRDYDAALAFVGDYFHMDYKTFLSKYFAGERQAEIQRNIRPEQYKRLSEGLSPSQLAVINDNTSKYIVVSAGPGSGKTKILVHKLASLLLLEDVKHEQLLMLTFSRAAATEFQTRLRELIQGAANYVEIKTFHSYCFDLLGKIGKNARQNDFDNIVKEAVKLLRDGEADPGRITKSVLVIDEAQDMDSSEYELVRILMEQNPDMRVIAVGDDDQNIYGFRGSDSKYMRTLIDEYGAKQYALLGNYRSSRSVVRFANAFAASMIFRMKTQEIQAVKDEKGEVKLIKHPTKTMEAAVAKDLPRDGTGCILTERNEDALLLLSLLRQNGLRAKLIQSFDDFELYHIAEIRYFLRQIDKDTDSPILTDKQWDRAIAMLRQQYRGSTCLPFILKVLNQFQETNPQKYRTDLEIFLRESKPEDFFEEEWGVITVSTLHKAKGKEFDHVCIMLRNTDFTREEEKRKVYVGITRAKRTLHIHYCGNFLDRFKESATSFETDLQGYPMPQTQILELSHRDVYLDFFKGKKEQILRLRSGMHLEIKGNCLYHGQTAVLQFSQAFYQNLRKLTAGGYTPYDAVIRFICAWKGSTDEEETAVILPDIYLERRIGDYGF